MRSEYAIDCFLGFTEGSRPCDLIWRMGMVCFQNVQESVQKRAQQPLAHRPALRAWRAGEVGFTVWLFRQRGFVGRRAGG